MSEIITPKESPTLKMNDESPPDSKNEDAFIKPSCINVRCMQKNSLPPTQSNTENSCSNQIILSKIKVEKSPSQCIAEKQIPIPYKEPTWSGLPSPSYSFEVIKNGIVIERIPFNKSFIIVGRLSNCDVILEHPSISRFHCVIQYRSEHSPDNPPGLYVYDLDSTHGTFQNKYRLEPQKFNRLRVGHILKFGGSTRMFVLQGPDKDQEPESPHTVTELKTLAIEKKLALQKLEATEQSDTVSEIVEKSHETEGINWGMGEDAVEDDDEGEACTNPFATIDELHLNDPKKTLRGWFEQKGHDLPEYQLQEIKPGYFQAKLELPVQSGNGKPLTCIVQHKGKKKDTVVQCALEACRILDRKGLLRQATHEGHCRRPRDWSENDYYDSDEDDFLDRTGDIDRKRERRKKETDSDKGIETYDSLTRQYSEVIESLEKLEKDLRLGRDLKKEREADSSALTDADELEAYMNHLSSQLPDKHKRTAWKLEGVRLQREEARLRKLINIARPLGVPELSERIFESLEPPKGSLKRPPTSAVTASAPHMKNKRPQVLRVHEAFLEEEDHVKVKLPKLSSDDEDDGGVRPVPYAKPQTSLDKYRALCRRIPKPPRVVLVSPTPKSEDAPCMPPSGSPPTPCPDTQEDDVSPSRAVTRVVPSEGEEDVSKKVAAPAPPEPSKGELKFAKPRPGRTRAKSKPQKNVPCPKERSLFDFEEQYEMWVPPKGQSGDGRTALNDKLGY